MDASGLEQGYMTVSIPIWCDYKKTIRLSVGNASVFQFQYGAIISHHLLKVFISHNLVSIPIWCDYKDQKISVSNVIEKFQFQYGAIIRSSTFFMSNFLGCFNSNMVRL